MQIISISNQKGGIGKTTTTQAMASGLMQKGFKVLLIDLDPQYSLSLVSGAKLGELSIYDVLKGKENINNAIQKTDLNIDIIPATLFLAAADLEFSQTGRESLLKSAISEIKEKYDYILIDTPPALGILTVNAFTASDKILIPMEADMLSTQGLGQLINTVNLVIKHCNPKLKIDGILLTKHKQRTRLAQDFSDTIDESAKQLNSKVYKTRIRESVSIREAQANKEDILKSQPNANAQIDYINFVEEFLGAK